jgi:hypothetical protein
MRKKLLSFGNRSFCVAAVVAVLVAASTAGAAPVMPPMDHIGPHPRSYSDKKPRTLNVSRYLRVLRVGTDGEHRTIASALAAAKEASSTGFVDEALRSPGGGGNLP